MSSKTELAREGVLFLLCGPAGGGKTTVGERLLAESSSTISRSISYTTRAPRAGEVNGRDYFFVSRDEFLAKKTRGDFFESEEIHGNLYGTAKETLDRAIADGRDLMLIIDIRGVFNVKKHFPRNSFSVFVAPPSFEELKRRVEARGSTSAQDLERRIGTAKEEYRMLVEGIKNGGVDYFVLNDQLEDAQRAVASILEAERAKAVRIAQSEIHGISKIG